MQRLFVRPNHRKFVRRQQWSAVHFEGHPSGRRTHRHPSYDEEDALASRGQDQRSVVQVRSQAPRLTKRSVLPSSRFSLGLGCLADPTLANSPGPSRADRRTSRQVSHPCRPTTAGLVNFVLSSLLTLPLALSCHRTRKPGTVHKIPGGELERTRRGRMFSVRVSESHLIGCS